MFKFFPWTALLFSLIIAILYQSVESDNAFSDIVFHSSAQVPRVLVLTAHPDDECMFFAPTIRALVSRIRTNRIPTSEPASDPVRLSQEVRVYSLCLSVGDADGLGSIRRKELGRSLDVLGIDENSRLVLDHPDLKDNFTAHWNPATIAEVLYPYVNEHRISTIFTFDDGGISGHPNHKSLPEGVQHLLSHQRYAFAAAPPKLFTLVTRSIPAKYTSILGPIWSKFTLYRIRLLSLGVQIIRIARGLGIELSPPISKPVMHGMPPVLVSGVSDYIAALRAMREHTSQLVWFRWLYVLFSRYMWVNEWVEVPVEQLSV